MHLPGQNAVVSAVGLGLIQCIIGLFKQVFRVFVWSWVTIGHPGAEGCNRTGRPLVVRDGFVFNSFANALGYG